MRKKKKKNLSYKELYKARLERNKVTEEFDKTQELIRIKSIAEDASEMFGLTKEEVFNAMGLYRFNI